MQTGKNDPILRGEALAYYGTGTEYFRAARRIREITVQEIRYQGIKTPFAPDHLVAMLDVAASVLEQLGVNLINLGSHKWGMFQGTPQQFSSPTSDLDTTTPKPPAGEQSDQSPKETTQSSKPNG